jgi:hypothetical protein
MKILGYFISVGGLIALIWTGINYINNSESFGFFGMDIAVSKGDPVPMIISLVVMVIGLIIARLAKN